MPETPLDEAPERDTLLVDDPALAEGFIQLPRIILRSRELSRDAKMLFAVLLDYAWQENRCFPGYTRLSGDLGASDDSVRKYMRELIAAGHVSQQRRGQGKTNLYTLHVRSRKTRVLEPGQTRHPEDRKSRRPDARKTRANLYADRKDSEEVRDPDPTLKRYTRGRYGHVVKATEDD